MEKINAILVLEILGRPLEYVKEALDNLVVKLGGEKALLSRTKLSTNQNQPKIQKIYLRALQN